MSSSLQSEKFVGYFVNELNLDEEFHLKLIGLKRADKVTNCLGISLWEAPCEE